MSPKEIWKWKWKWKPLSCDRLFVTPWAIESMEFPRPEYWSGQPFPSPGDLPNPGIKPRSPALQTDSLPAEPPGNPMKMESKSNFPPKTKELWFFLLMLVYFCTRDLLFSFWHFPSPLGLFSAWIHLWNGESLDLESKQKLTKITNHVSQGWKVLGLFLSLAHSRLTHSLTQPRPYHTPYVCSWRHADSETWHLYGFT